MGNLSYFLIEQTNTMNMEKSSVAIAVDIFRLENTCTEPLELPVAQGCYLLIPYEHGDLPPLLWDTDQRNICFEKDGSNRNLWTLRHSHSKTKSRSRRVNWGIQSFEKRAENTVFFFRGFPEINVSRLDLSYYKASERFGVWSLTFTITVFADQQGETIYTSSERTFSGLSEISVTRLDLLDRKGDASERYGALPFAFMLSCFITVVCELIGASSYKLRIRGTFRNTQRKALLETRK